MDVTVCEGMAIGRVLFFPWGTTFLFNAIEEYERVTFSVKKF